MNRSTNDFKFGIYNYYYSIHICYILILVRESSCVLNYFFIIKIVLIVCFDFVWIQVLFLWLSHRSILTPMGRSQAELSIRGAFNKVPDFFVQAFKIVGLLEIQYVTAIHLMRWQTNFTDFFHIGSFIDSTHMKLYSHSK